MDTESLGRRIGRLRGALRRRELESVIAQWERWNGTQIAFCESLGISTQSLHRWRAYVKSESLASPGAAFIEVHAPSPSASSYEIVLPSGTSVRAPAGFDDAEVSRLLALAKAAC